MTCKGRYGPASLFLDDSLPAPTACSQAVPVSEIPLLHTPVGSSSPFNPCHCLTLLRVFSSPCHRRHPGQFHEPDKLLLYCLSFLHLLSHSSPLCFHSTWCFSLGTLSHHISIFFKGLTMRPCPTPSARSETCFTSFEQMIGMKFGFYDFHHLTFFFCHRVFCLFPLSYQFPSWSS